MEIKYWRNIIFVSHTVIPCYISRGCERLLRRERDSAWPEGYRGEAGAEDILPSGTRGTFPSQDVHVHDRQVTKMMKIKKMIMRMLMMMVLMMMISDDSDE